MHNAFVDGLRAFLDEFEARGGRITALELENAELRELLEAVPPPVEPEPPVTKLKYAPPTLVAPETRVISKKGTVTLDPTKDYILKLQGVIDGYVPIVGGRNWTLIGGEFNIPHQGARPSITSRTALKVVDCEGTAHIEGVSAHGVDMSEFLQIDAPNAIVQVQNCRADGMDIRHDAGWTDPQHPDAIQPYGGCRALRVHRFTFITRYQGLFLAATLAGSWLGDVELTDVNGVGEEGARYLMWFAAQGKTTLENVWAKVHPGRAGGFGKSLMPDIDTGKMVLETWDNGHSAARWINTINPIDGYVEEGTPPVGDYVPEGVAGVGYLSPGYVLEA